MDCKDAYDIAVKIADLCAKILQFFIAICALFGGWIVVKGLPPETYLRVFLAMSFACSTGAMAFTLLALFRRANAAIALSRQLYEESPHQHNPSVTPLFAKNETVDARYGASFGLFGVILSIVVLIFLAPSQESDRMPPWVASIAEEIDKM